METRPVEKKRETLTLKQILIVCVATFVLFVSGLCIGWNYGYLGVKSPFTILSKRSPSLLTIARSVQLIEDNYDGSVDQQKFTDNVLTSMVLGLGDPYSFYVNKYEYERLKAEDTGKSVGIGVRYTIKDHIPTVIEVIPGTPAQEAGLVKGDKILTVDTGDLTKLSNDVEIRNRIRGAAGQSSVFTIEHNNGAKAQITMTRRSFVVSVLSYSVFQAEVGYLKVYQFSPQLQKEFDAVKKQITDTKPKKLIIDLRNNFGGATVSTIYLADQFIKSGIIVREKYKDSKEDEITNASGKAPFPNLPIIVLVNADTSSAAEIFVAAIQDNSRGKIVGEKTFGKGVSQMFFDFADGSAIYLTIGRWFTPNGASIHDKGIIPDVEIVDEADGEKDPLLEKAKLL